MTDGMKTQYGSRITLIMEVLVEVVHKLVNYAFLCETFCALCTRVSYLSINVYDGRSEVLLDSSGHINNIQEPN